MSIFHKYRNMFCHLKLGITLASNDWKIETNNLNIEKFKINSKGIKSCFVWFIETNKLAANGVNDQL